ncbi:MAG: aspartate kinase [Tissierella sp.]|nr:aspartate kinase [Tissierella sp.]
MSVIIQKFGGTSLRNLNKKSEFLKLVKKEVDLGSKLVVVVSAMGRKGDPYATDTLINQLENISTSINPRKKDLIMSVGELISAALASHLLESEGYDAQALTGFQAGIITDDNFNSCKIIEVNTKKLEENLRDDIISVVAGFQGVTEDMYITTLGRGGSDTTAVALGGSLNVERVDIFTDVPGVAITDPRIVPNTKYIKKISYDDMYRLAISGANVIHPNAVLLGKQYNIPIRVLSTFIDCPGTLVSNEESNLKVIGFGIKEQENHSIISFIFNRDYKYEIKEELGKFLLDEKEDLIDMEFFDDKATIVVKNQVLPEFLQRLYFHFMK